MSYRRRQQLPRRPSAAPVAAAGQYDYEPSSAAATPSSSSSSYLAAKAIEASSARIDSSLSSAYATAPPSPSPSPSPSKEEFRYSSHEPVKPSAEPKHGFWGALARKAKSIIDDDNKPETPEIPEQNVQHKQDNAHQSHQARRRSETPALQKGLDVIASSLSYIGTAVEDGLNIVENRAAELIQERRKNIKKKPGRSEDHDPAYVHQPAVQQSRTEPKMQTEQEIQLKASRDVAMAMAAKAKLLLRELKTVKADFAFAKERCAQLEEENKMLRERHGGGDGPEDDDLIRLQLETLLAEKARLAHENSVYARENRFLREVVEYHQLTMQDVVYLDEASEEVNEVYPTSKASLMLNRPAPATAAPMSPASTICPVPPPGMR